MCSWVMTVLIWVWFWLWHKTIWDAEVSNPLLTFLSQSSQEKCLSLLTVQPECFIASSRSLTYSFISSVFQSMSRNFRQGWRGWRGSPASHGPAGLGEPWLESHCCRSGFLTATAQDCSHVAQKALLAALSLICKSFVLFLFLRGKLDFVLKLLCCYLSIQFF